MKRSVREHIHKHHLFESGDNVLVAVSGGVDSMVLLHWLHHFCANISVTAAHVDHNLRPESVNDSRLVQKFCAAEGIPFVNETLKAADYTAGANIQAEARRLRYNALETAASLHGCRKIATAHHADDQLETIWMAFARGTWGEGNWGIPPKRRADHADIEVVRPFLPVEKSEIKAYAANYQIAYAEDESNASDKYTRNRFRRMLPLLKAENPSMLDQLQPQLDRLNDERDWMKQEAEAALSKVAVFQNDHVELSCSALIERHAALQQHMVKIILGALYESSSATPSAIHIDACLRLATADHPSARIDLPGGLQAERMYDRLFFRPAPQSLPDAGCCQQINIPGTVNVETGVLHAWDTDELPAALQDPGQLVLSAAEIEFPLHVRTRRRQDVMQPAGMHGTKKLKRILIDAKVPALWRNTWPVIVDNSGWVVWVPGVKKGSAAWTERLPKEAPYVVLNFTSAPSFQERFEQMVKIHSK
ncbi:tRNA(Ile)-lysidine synthase [Salsuginibacillus halophilus]|uniref:tRNA(Ile)-lysidine synthase n=1 Tax=Salsuginibacillus halophilus TaxID=517424 RepID=A0A2P8H7V0_9BACI|nr:tRNA lysidine(34) synthetase TilS [Salsuginibacillus halophilus]PSL42271.1 tRNA(Ile)-lysidine synthase [Salsuginibacillus halophilus]